MPTISEPKVAQPVLAETPQPTPEVTPQLELQQPVANDTDLPILNSLPAPEAKVSAFSLSSIKAKRELEAQHKSVVKESIQYPTEPFNETAMLFQWNKFAQKLEDKGQMILHSLLLINDPKLEGTTIVHELPNEGTKIEFERVQNELLGYLRGMLHNHDISLQLHVNESIENKRAFTPQDKYNRLNQINPSLEVLRKTFDLDL